MIQQICLFMYWLLRRPFIFLSFVGEGASGISGGDAFLKNMSSKESQSKKYGV